MTLCTSIEAKRCRFDFVLCQKTQNICFQPNSSTEKAMAAMLKLTTLNPFPSYFRESALVDCPLIRPQFKGSRNFQFNLCLNRSKNGPAFPVVKAQSSPDYTPDAQFYKVEAILRPWRIQQVSSALLKMGIRGVTISDVRGFGAQGGMAERQAGSEFSEDKFVAKVKMEIVVSKDQVEAVIDKINEVARTGEIGDGKIFLVPIADVIRVRTGERGEMAERMTGGRADMSAATPPA